MPNCCAGHLLCCVLARRSPYLFCTVSRLAAGRLASGPARDALHAPGPLQRPGGSGVRYRASLEGGFSLLEVLVAFVILALVGTALFRLFGASRNNASLADEYSRATLYAESRLATAAVETPLRERSDQGASDDGRYAWSTKVESYIPPGMTADQERLAQMLPVRLWRLTVTVTWPTDVGGQRTMVLSTVRLASKQP
jgi:general secretion pathway protein I